MSRGRGTTTLSKALHAGVILICGSSAGSQLIEFSFLAQEIRQQQLQLMQELLVNPTAKNPLIAAVSRAPAAF
jgi:hypothetical protein